MKIVNYDDCYKNDLNLWQAMEKQMGLSWFDDFVVVKGVLLGDYIEMINYEMSTVCKLAFVEEKLVGFVCFEKKECGEYHIEIMGVNPSCRGKGYAKQILQTLKKYLSNESDFSTLTLSVNKNNKAGQRSFVKVCTKIGINENQNYIDFQV